MRTTVSLLAILVGTLLISGCIGQNPTHTGYYSITKDGVEYVFSSDIRESMKVPVEGKDEIMKSLAFAQKIVIVFMNSTDNSLFAKSGFELTSKLQHYYVYSQNRIVNISAQEFTDAPLPSDALIIGFRGPSSGADTTGVRSIGKDYVLVLGINATDFSMAADRLVLLLFEDSLSTV